METIQQLNSDSTDDTMESSQQEEAAKGFRSLPRELRDKIYKLVLLPEPRCITHCMVQHFNGAHLASTYRPTEMQSLCMDITSIRPCAGSRGRSTVRPEKTASILLACRQIFQEASQVLYENTELYFKPGHWVYTLKIAAVNKFSIDCPTYALQHIRAVSLAVYSGQRLLTFYGREFLGDRLRLPNLKVVKLHFDIDTGTPYATPFKFLYAIADHVEFVVDVHITSTFVDDGTGWGEQLLDMDRSRDANQGTYAGAWAAVKERAFQKRAAFVKELGDIFQERGKKLKVKDT